MASKGKTAALTELYLLLAVVFLGTNPVAVKLAVRDIPPLPFVALRFVAAGVLLLAVARIFGGHRVPRGRDLAALAGVGALGVGLNNVAFTLGVSMTTASDTALIYAAVPIWGMLLGLALGLERPERRGVAGVGLAFCGVAVIVWSGSGAGGSSLEGNLLVALATVCWGSYAVLSLPLLRVYPPVLVAACTMLFGGLAAIPAALPGLVDAGWLAGVGGVAWAATAYSTLLVAAFGFWAWQRGVSQTGANRVLVYQYLITLVGVISGIGLLGEELSAARVLGGAVVLVGVYLARRRPE